MTPETLELSLTGGNSTAFKIFIILTALSFAPAVMVSLTSFTRVVIVLSFLRQALGTQQLPPNQVILGLSIFLTLFIMGGTTGQVYENALKPFLDDKMTWTEAAEQAQGPLTEFMLEHTREEDLLLFLSISGRDTRPSTIEEVPFTVIVPAFMISELTTAFRMGLTIFIPLLLIDILVSSLLLALGMMMMPPTMVSLPIKLGVFILADGWHLVVKALAGSFF